MDKLKIGLAQFAPVWMNREKTLEKALTFAQLFTAWFIWFLPKPPKTNCILSRRVWQKIGWSKNMKKTEKETEMETSKEAKKAGLKRIERKHFAKSSDVKLSDCKVKITINLDADILEYFKQRAAPPHSAPYQTQINNELRRMMEADQSEDNLTQTVRELLKDDNFILALKDRLKAA